LLRLTPVYLAEIIRLVESGKVNTTTARACWRRCKDRFGPADIVEQEGLGRVSDDAAIRSVCQEVLAESPKEVESYKSGKVT